jgi:acyl-ACP thioesterase
MITYPTNIYPKNNYLDFDKLRFDDFKIDNDYDYVVRYCDLDLNNHMNNTKYSDIVNFDYSKIIKFCQIDYIHEVRYEDTLKVKTMNIENGLKVEGISNDNISFRMLFNYQ